MNILVHKVCIPLISTVSSLLRSGLAFIFLSLFFQNYVLADCQLKNGQAIQGVATHFGFTDRSLQSIEKIPHAGFSSIRDEVFWTHVEDAKGNLAIPEHIEAMVKQALHQGIQPILVLGYGHPNYDEGDKPISPRARAGWRKYAEFVVKHFKGRVHSYELWNEWDIAIGGTKAGKPQDYAKLVNEVAPALHQIDPTLCLIAGAVTHDAIENGWLNKAIHAGLLDEVDALSIHTYNYYRKSTSKNTPEAWLDDTRKFNLQLNSARLKKSLPLYMTEMGWPSDSGPQGISPELQAAYAQRLFLLAQTLPSLYGVWWYGWQDEGDKPEESEHHFGVLDRQNHPKPIWFALQEQAKLLQNMHWKNFENFESKHQIGLRFQSNVDSPLAQTLAIWSMNSKNETLVLQSDETSNATVHFSTSCHAQQTSQGWRIQFSERPCLARIEGRWNRL